MWRLSFAMMSCAWDARPAQLLDQPVTSPSTGGLMMLPADSVRLAVTTGFEALRFGRRDQDADMETILLVRGFRWRTQLSGLRVKLPEPRTFYAGLDRRFHAAVSTRSP